MAKSYNGDLLFEYSSYFHEIIAAYYKKKQRKDLLLAEAYSRYFPYTKVRQFWRVVQDMHIKSIIRVQRTVEMDKKHVLECF